MSQDPEKPHHDQGPKHGQSLPHEGSGHQHKGESSHTQHGHSHDSKASHGSHQPSTGGSHSQPQPSPSLHSHQGHHRDHDKAKKKSSVLGWIIGIVVLVVVVVLIYIGLHKKPKKAPAPPPIPVAEAKAHTGSINVILDGLGIVTPVYTVTLNSRVTGQITEVDYQEGQLVKKGDKLVVVDPRPYAAILAQAAGSLAQGKALLDNARIDLKRYQDAFKTHAIPQQQLATQEATVKGDEGTVQLDQANVDAAQLNLDFCTITSPIDGRVGLRDLDPGNIVTANSTTMLATITQLQPITVIFTVPEDSLGEIAPEIKPGQPLRVDALDRAETKTLATGRLGTLDNQVNTATGTIKARATFDNTKNELFPNQFVNAKLYIKTLQNVVLVPNAAVQHNEQAAFVYVVGPDNKVKSTSVTVTVTEGDTAAVTGIQSGDTLVTDGFEKLQDGTMVSVKDPNAGKDKAKATGADGNPPVNAPGNAAPKPTTGA